MKISDHTMFVLGGAASGALLAMAMLSGCGKRHSTETRKTSTEKTETVTHGDGVKLVLTPPKVEIKAAVTSPK